MTQQPPACDILLLGTGFFAEVMLTDLSATATTPLRVVVGGRNAARMGWLVDACRSRAVIHDTPIRFDWREVDFTSAETLAEAIGALRPKVVVQAASLQSPWKVDIGDSAWSHLVARAGFGTTIAFNAMLAWRAAEAVRLLGDRCHFVNTCYPDGVNPLLEAAGLPITTGVGNIGIFPGLIGGRLPAEDLADFRVLAHHRHLVEWRKPGPERAGAPVRAWCGAKELEGINAMTLDIQLPYRDLNLISAASAVPVLLALAGEGARRCHVPGPYGLPGGYPATVDETGLRLDLPPGLSEAEAIAWNRQFEEADGVSVRDGRVTYSANARAALAEHSVEIAEGFAAADLEDAFAAVTALRERLGG
ncbi:hypothetical protein [Acuticoccus mangrovi]|uniref:Saccharopine dehydrogenase NADP binding domain-containing protein n=1 Tax=Acuticoccus mangrovi TaxID=2796142 RepID=A0A934IQA9_9HYPH|nr:hypothetical protein [Acuticoccus mangrovi]MBJ3776736.1 hypothetical protein [Acuticoccus mangrovi]